MNETTTTDGRTGRRTYLKIAGAGALAAGVAGCLGFGGTLSGQNSDSGGGASENDEEIPASFACSQFLETHPYSRDEPTFSFQFVVPKNWEVDSTLSSESRDSTYLLAPATMVVNDIAHSLRIVELKDSTERKGFADLYTETIGYEKLDPRPYGSDEMIVLYIDRGVITDTNVKRTSYTWLLGLPTDTDGQVRQAKISGHAGTNSGEVPFCKEAIKKTTEKTVNSIQPK